MLNVSCPARFLTRWFSALLLLAAVALATVPGAASAAVQWHTDLDAARTAARVSGKPVFVLFAADWDDHAAAAVLSTAEVDAVITACFEPVRIDVDTQPELTRTLGVDRVPCLAVLDAKDGVITKFECPATPAEFVAATARAAQVAAAATVPSAPTEFAAGREVSPFGDPLDHALEPVASNVTEKVRQLSSFADGKPMPLRDPERFPAIVREPDNHGQLDAAPTALAGAADTPALDRTPPAWPAERPPASAFSQPEIATASAATPATTASDIEPAPAATGPWLSGTTTAPAEQAASEAAATASEVTADPAPESSSFMATLTKPFTSLFSWSSKPAVEQPPKMPAARPQSPAQVAASGAAPAVEAPAAAPAPVADTHGSMPLGLEGYCPVSVVERGAWVEGRAQWGVRHRGRTYLFAGPEQQTAFLAAPDRFAPALSGDDPVLAFESGTSEPGRRTFGVTYQSRMYLFASADTRAAFTADPARYTARVQIAEGLPQSDAARRF